jgi:hypothetical protein
LMVRHFKHLLLNSYLLLKFSALLWNQVSSMATCVFIEVLIHSQPRTKVSRNRPSFRSPHKSFLELPLWIGWVVFHNIGYKLHADKCKSLGFTTERLPPTEDHTLPERFSLGLVSPLPDMGFTHTSWIAL